uniref:Uncharacterized protein n=1 Tax=Arundo donax TaxID=35708 RepID=A0A0A9AWT2_ARUDO
MPSLSSRLFRPPPSACSCFSFRLG